MVKNVSEGSKEKLVVDSPGTGQNDQEGPLILVQSEIVCREEVVFLLFVCLWPPLVNKNLKR